MPVFEIFESFAVFLLMFFVFVKHYCALLKHLFFYFPLENWGLSDKGSFLWTELLFLCHEPMSTSLSSFNNTFFKKVNHLCLFSWTTWVIWIWAANSSDCLFACSTFFLLKVQPSGVFQSYERLCIDALLGGGSSFLLLSLMHMIPWILRLKFIRFNKCLQGRSNFCFPLASQELTSWFDFAIDNHFTCYPSIFPS